MNRYEPTSHQYLYEMGRKNLFALFAGAVASLKVDDDGCHCQSAEAQGLSRLARAVQARADSSVPRESALAGMARVLRVLLMRTDRRDRGVDHPDWYMSLSELVAHFLRLRADLEDMLPQTGMWCPVPVPDDLSEMPTATVVRDTDGRLWGELDPDDVVLSDEEVAVLPHCVACQSPMVPGVDHSGCSRIVA